MTARVPAQKTFLINPYGLMYDEVTASNLVKIDLEGNIVEKSEWDINPAGFIIHSAIHSSKKMLTALCTHILMQEWQWQL